MTDRPVRIGPYAVTGELGRGGAGVVWAAGPDVAVKVLTRGDPEELTRELRTLATLDHPGIVRILGHGLHDGRPWFAMERVDGPTFQDRLRVVEPVDTSRTFSFDEPQDALPPVPEGLDERLRVVKRLCRTLAWLHGEGVVHRDLKPANVLLRGGIEPVLVDFGIAGAFGGRESVVGMGPVAGTLGFLAPEQARGELVDARADLFAVGCLLWACLTGGPPLDPGQPRVSLQRLRRWEPVAPSLAVDGVPPALDALVLRLLSADPAARPGHADEVVDALEALGVDDRGPALPSARARLYRPPLIGRVEPMVRLRSLLASGRQRGGLALVEAAPGLGASRMLAETVAAARPLGFGCVAGVGDPELTRSGPLHPLRALLRALSASRDRVEVDEVLEPWLGGRAPADRGDPWALPQALARATVRLARVRPLLVVLDGLHDADETTLRWLADLTIESEVEPSPLVVVGAFDPAAASEPVRALAGAVERIVLAPLSEAELVEVAAGMLAAPAPAGLPVGRAGGSPTVLAELLLAGLDQGWLCRRGSAWQVDPAAELPPSVDASSDARIGSLAPDDRLEAARAAALGERLTEERLLALGCPPAALHRLLRARVLERDAEGLRFPHAALRRAAGRVVDDATRRDAHAAIAALLEAEGVEAEVVAAHLDAAGADPSAAWARAVEEHLARGAPREARLLAERLAERSPSAANELRVAQAARAMADADAVVAACDRAARLDPTRSAEADLLAGRALDRAERFDDARPYLERVAARPGADGLVARALLVGADADRGALDATDRAEALIALADAADPEVLAVVLHTAGRCAFARVDHDGAERWWRRALPLASGEQRRSLLASLAVLDRTPGPTIGFGHLLADADESLRAGQLASARIPFHNLGYRYGLWGQTDVALGLVGGALRLALAVGAAGESSTVLALLAQLEHALGAPDRAREHLALALRLGSPRGRQRLRLLAVAVALHLEPGHRDRALAYGRATLALSDELGVTAYLGPQFERTNALLERDAPDEVAWELLRALSLPRAWRWAWLEWGGEALREAAIASCLETLAAEPDEYVRRILLELGGAWDPPPPMPLPSPLVRSWMCDPGPLVEVVRREFLAVPPTGL